MIFVALGIVALTILVGLGRGHLRMLGFNREITLVLALAAAGAAAWDALRGGWLGGSILLTAAAWLAASSRAPQPPGSRPERTPSGMGRREAASMLGVAETASPEEIEAAYRRLMFRVHPDQGGAAGLAAQINAARSVLLGR